VLGNPKDPKADGHENILHFEHVIIGRLVADVNSSTVPMSPRHLNLADPVLGEGKVVSLSNTFRQ